MLGGQPLTDMVSSKQTRTARSGSGDGGRWACDCGGSRVATVQIGVSPVLGGGAMHGWEPRVLVRRYLEQGLSKAAVAERLATYPELTAVRLFEEVRCTTNGCLCCKRGNPSSFRAGIRCGHFCGQTAPDTPGRIRTQRETEGS